MTRGEVVSGGEVGVWLGDVYDLAGGALVISSVCFFFVGGGEFLERDSIVLSLGVEVGGGGRVEEWKEGREEGESGVEVSASL